MQPQATTVSKLTRFRTYRLQKYSPPFACEYRTAFAKSWGVPIVSSALNSSIGRGIRTSSRKPRRAAQPTLCPGAAPRVVPALAPIRARQAVARECKRFFSRLFPCRDADTDDTDVLDWRLRGASPQYDASPSWLGKSSISMEITSSDAVFDPIPQMVSRHR